MGWFIGVFGQNKSLKNRISAVCQQPLFTAENETFYIAGGGHPQTIHFKNRQESSLGWMASGIGISIEAEPRFLNKNSWGNEISKGTENLHQKNGHFALAKWEQNKLELVTDQLGMRNIFIHQGEGFMLFSTRLDWLMKLVPTTINWKKFGSRWMAINQFSSDSFVNGIQRLSQGGHAIITPEKVSVTNKRWDYKEQNSSDEQFKQSLFYFTAIALKENRPLSLGLSGGLDSRTLFATLLSQPDADWRLHTFGEENHPDLNTAKALNSSYGRQHYVFHEEIPQASQLINMLPDFIGQTLFTSTPSHLVGFQAYQKIADLNLSVVDGGFGEIARRRFLVSLLLLGKKALLNKNTDGILPFFRLPRADIFTEACNAEMMEGFREELSTEIDAMPEIAETGIENWLDLFSIRTRVPNGAGPEQARSDSHLFNYMPFLQPQLIQQAINLPLTQRKEARLFREIISKEAPELQNVELVKGSVSYPYWMKDLSSAVWMRLKQKAGKNYTSTQQEKFLLVLEEYVRDLFYSSSARNFTEYDQAKVQKLITGFYEDKNTSFAHELSWLLAFEVFRRNGKT
ncbi:MAG: hypothetical protein WD059_03895 [Balneolaceae bacterium]